MRALVVYESMYGNTHLIASSIADGLRETHEVTVVPVAGATTELVASADLLVAGAPTHMHGLPRAATRRMAADAAGKTASDLWLDPAVLGPGLSDWLDGLGHTEALAAAFDTRFNGVPLFTGRASLSIGRLLKRHGYRLVAAPESFLVSQQNTLLDGEAARARRWGTALGAAAGNVSFPARA
jgi:Flavodoxin domain